MPVWRNYTRTAFGWREWGVDYLSLALARHARSAWPWPTTTRRAKEG